MTPNRLKEIEARLKLDADPAALAGMELLAEVKRLNELINNPHTNDFLEAVRLEAAHQLERWGNEHDAQKSDADFYWTLGWLAGKAVRYETEEKRLHHIVTSAALCLNWHRLAKSAGVPLPIGKSLP